MSFAWGYKYQLVFTKIEYTMTAQCSVSTAGYVLLMAKFLGEVIFDIVFVQQLFYSENKTNLSSAIQLFKSISDSEVKK